MQKPSLSEIPAYYQPYVNLVEFNDLIQGLIQGGNATLDLLKSIPEKSGDYKYAAGKWTIKEVVAHLMDSERVFAYRAMTFARNDKTDLPGFEQNDWAQQTNAENRRLYKMIDEYNNLRASTIDLFGSFNEEMLTRSGTANGTGISVRGIGFVILGHEIHHCNILNERYFS